MDVPFDLDTLITPTPVESGGGANGGRDAETTPPWQEFELEIVPGLAQGRSTWGGLATGAMARAAAAVEPDDSRSLRTLAAHLVGRLPVGRHRLTAEVLRRGLGTTTVALRIGEAGALAAHGVAVLAGPRQGPAMPDGPSWLHVAPPPALSAGWRGVPVLAAAPAAAPEFFQQLEVRFLTGIPFSGEAGMETTGWVRPRSRVAAFDEALLAALADAWPVAVMTGLAAPRPVATLSYTLDIPGVVGDVPRDGDTIEPLFHRGRVLAAREGYTVETRELWTADGRLLSWNTQTVAVIS